MSTKSCSYLFITWLYQEGQDFLDTQYLSLKDIKSDPQRNIYKATVIVILFKGPPQRRKEEVRVNG